MEAEERPNKIRKIEHGGQSAQIVPQAHHDLSSAEHTSPAAADTELEAGQNGKDEKSNTAPVPQAGVEAEHVSDIEGEALPLPEQTAPTLATIQTSPEDPPLSKSKMKKLRRQAEWEAKKPERKALKKEKLHAKRERKREEKRQASEANPEAATESKTPQPQPQAVQLPVTFLIDCDFDDLMLDGERKSLATQITRSYSDNKNSHYRAHLAICSFGGELRNRFDTILSHYKNWKGFRTYDCNFVETAEHAKQWMTTPGGGKLAGVFTKYSDLDENAKAKLKGEGEVVYLTSEGDEDLTELKPYSTYIIGGLVDRNREKGICFKRARKQNLRTAKLPIGDFMEMSSRKVLATNHVNEIMLKWLECGDWGEAFVKVIPKRKGGKLKDAKDEADEQSPEQSVHEEENGTED